MNVYIHSRFVEKDRIDVQPRLSDPPFRSEKGRVSERYRVSGYRHLLRRLQNYIIVERTAPREARAVPVAFSITRGSDR
jgi:hypothetical protein